MAAIIGLALGKLMFQVGDDVKTQIDLDRFTGKHLLRMRASALAMEASYARLDVYRAGVLAVCAASLGLGCPEAIAAFNEAALVERTIQQVVKIDWTKNSVEWAGTFKKNDRPIPLFTLRSAFPAFPFPILKEESFSLFDLRTSRFSQNSSPTMKIAVQTLTLRSEATLTKESKHGWAVYWTK